MGKTPALFTKELYFFYWEGANSLYFPHKSIDHVYLNLFQNSLLCQYFRLQVSMFTKRNMTEIWLRSTKERDRDLVVIHRSMNKLRATASSFPVHERGPYSTWSAHPSFHTACFLGFKKYNILNNSLRISCMHIMYFGNIHLQTPSISCLLFHI